FRRVRHDVGGGRASSARRRAASGALERARAVAGLGDSSGRRRSGRLRHGHAARGALLLAGGGRGFRAGGGGARTLARARDAAGGDRPLAAGRGGSQAAPRERATLQSDGDLAMAKRSPIIVGLDIGTYKISAVVAEIGENGVEIVGIGTSPSRGLRKGVV